MGLAWVRRVQNSLGGLRRSVSDPPRVAGGLALTAARAAGAVLVGVDLVPEVDGSWTIIELNGAVESTSEHQLGEDVFDCAAAELVRAASCSPCSKARRR